MDDAPDENEALKRKIDAAKMPKEAKEKAEAELQKLKMMSPMSAEATVVRGYIDWMVQVPWNARSKVKKTCARPRKSSIPTITALSASKTAFWNTSRSRAVLTKSKGRSSAWSGRRGR